MGYLRPLAGDVKDTLGLVYLGGAVVHLVFWSGNRGVYAAITPYTLLGWFRSLWTGVVLPNLRVLLPLLAAFEALVAVAVVCREKAARAGLVGGAVFNVTVAPLGFWWPSNVALAAVHLALLRVPHPETTRTQLRGRLVSRGDSQ